MILVSPAACPPTTSCDCGPSSQPSDSVEGPCPGQGYSCECCLDGWFCPPPQTPALPVPCGFGWPCYHCPGGYFCVPSPTAGDSSGLGPSPSGPPPQVPATNTPPSISVVTSVVTTTASPPAPPPAPPKPSSYQDGWGYAGCYRDDADRSLKGDNSLTQPETTGMTNAQCIQFCQIKGWSMSGTEFGSQCFCGNELLDSWLIDDSRCNMTCTGDANDICGGPYALAIYSPKGTAPEGQGPELRFTLTEPPPGVPTSVHIGGVRQTVLPVTSAIFVFPAPPSPPPPPPSPESTCISSTPTESPTGPVINPIPGGGPGPALPPGGESSLPPASPNPDVTASARPGQSTPGVSSAPTPPPASTPPGGSSPPPENPTAPPAGPPASSGVLPSSGGGQGSTPPAGPTPSNTNPAAPGQGNPGPGGPGGPESPASPGSEPPYDASSPLRKDTDSLLVDPGEDQTRFHRRRIATRGL